MDCRGNPRTHPGSALIDLLGRDYLKDYIKKVKASLPRNIDLLPKTDQATLKKMEKELLSTASGISHILYSKNYRMEKLFVLTLI